MIRDVCRAQGDIPTRSSHEVGSAKGVHSGYFRTGTPVRQTQHAVVPEASAALLASRHVTIPEPGQVGARVTNHDAVKLQVVVIRFQLQRVDIWNA